MPCQSSPDLGCRRSTACTTLAVLVASTLVWICGSRYYSASFKQLVDSLHVATNRRQLSESIGQTSKKFALTLESAVQKSEKLVQTPAIYSPIIVNISRTSAANVAQSPVTTAQTTIVEDCRPRKFGLRQPCPSLPIRRDTFLYMVMGAGHPNKTWLERSKWENVSLLYTAWKINISGMPAPSSRDKFRATFFPESTWPTGRNQQLQEAYDWETQQQWRFEFFIFFDEDAYLSYQQADDPSNEVSGDNDDHAMLRFNQLLLRDRPFRAGILKTVDAASAFRTRNLRCMHQCQSDHVVAAFHRTAVELLLPYSTQFDKTSWWMSAWYSNIMTAIVAPAYCNYYRDVAIDMSRQQHAKYPREWISAAVEDSVLACLSSNNYSDFTSTGHEQLKKKAFPHLEPTTAEQCARNPVDVDFSVLLKPNLTHWPTMCL